MRKETEGRFSEEDSRRKGRIRLAETSEEKKIEKEKRRMKNGDGWRELTSDEDMKKDKIKEKKGLEKL